VEVAVAVREEESDLEREGETVTDLDWVVEAETLLLEDGVRLDVLDAVGVLLIEIVVEEVTLGNGTKVFEGVTVSDLEEEIVLAGVRLPEGDLEVEAEEEGDLVGETEGVIVEVSEMD
jgi:hypothetical protein